jgi:hypothetical protein
MLSYFLQVLIGVALATSIEYIVPISFKLPADKDDKQKAAEQTVLYGPFPDAYTIVGIVGGDNC